MSRNDRAALLTSADNIENFWLGIARDDLRTDELKDVARREAAALREIAARIEDK